MTEDNPIIATATGDNFAATELSVGVEARKLIATYERQLRRHDKITAEIHETIVAFGRLLLVGKEMYPSPKEFGWWIERRGLNSGRLAKHQTERSACMTIARLHDVGAELETDEASGILPPVPVRLDLTGCSMTTPTDVMKWARKTHRHLFPQLRRGESPGKTPAERPASTARRDLEAELADRDETVTALQGRIDDMSTPGDRPVMQLLKAALNLLTKADDAAFDAFPAVTPKKRQDLEKSVSKLTRQLDDLINEILDLEHPDGDDGDNPQSGAAP